MGQGLLSIVASRSHSDTPHLVGLLWKSDRAVAETTHNAHKRDRDSHAPGWIQTHSPSKCGAENYALNLAATRIGRELTNININIHIDTHKVSKVT